MLRLTLASSFQRLYKFKDHIPQFTIVEPLPDAKSKVASLE